MTPRGYTEIHRLSPDMRSPQYFEWVEQVAVAQKLLKPWTLLPLPGETCELVARRHTWWWRLVTRWHNWRRRWTRAAYDAGFARRSHRG